MSSLPGPVDPRTLRASDQDRDRVADVLNEAVSRGRITFDELEERLGLVYAAKTYADLEVLTRDLPAPGTVLLPAEAAGGLQPDRVGGQARAKYSFALLSAARRRGYWVVPRRYTAVSLLGNVNLDLRRVQFSEPEATIHAYALLGSIEIIVPDDIEVDVGGIPIMATFDHKASGPGPPGAPRLRVIGVALMGDVSVKRKPLPEQDSQELPLSDRQELPRPDRQELPGREA